MSNTLATSSPLPTEADTVEGRLADIIECGDLVVDEYRFSSSDKARIVLALRQAANQGGRDAN